MPKQAFALEPGGKKRLEVSWKRGFEKVFVWFDGRVVGFIPDRRALSAGQEVRLPDSSTVTFQVVRKFLSRKLRALRNGQPLPKTVSDPERRWKNAYGVLYLIAGINLVLGTVALLFNVEFLQQLGAGLGSILFGLVFLILGYFIQRKSVAALITAIVLFAFDALVGVVLAVAEGGTPSTGGLVAKGIFLY
ncbi:MAG: hypothetical protein D6743_09500, partial [Calditrichaeota bacterium]